NHPPRDRKGRCPAEGDNNTRSLNRTRLLALPEKQNPAKNISLRSGLHVDGNPVPGLRRIPILGEFNSSRRRCPSLASAIRGSVPGRFAGRSTPAKKKRIIRSAGWSSG